MLRNEERASEGFSLAGNRRHFLSALALGAAAFTVPGAFATELIHTPAQTEGPFYPDKLPLAPTTIVINES
jgi:protocatechuate 3,4-dioxygenase beta subunit